VREHPANVHLKGAGKVLGFDGTGAAFGFDGTDAILGFVGTVSVLPLSCAMEVADFDFNVGGLAGGVTFGLSTELLLGPAAVVISFVACRVSYIVRRTTAGLMTIFVFRSIDAR
jgi:hypothetical protein